MKFMKRQYRSASRCLAFSLAGLLMVASTGCANRPATRAQGPVPALSASGGGDAPSMPVVRAEAMSGEPRTEESLVEGTPTVGGAMEVCLYEAEQLQRLGNTSQKSLVAGLYRNIRAAQAYTPMAQKLSPGTASTVTPLYEYAVNDACNSVEQALLSVLKKQVPATGGGRD
ncbi:hypothetical protein C3709_22260 [Lelliottia aquatilis]|uniref:Lipoprotein n=2 Tax=Enterobacteriaceae TaxID=543 RepID=A0ABX4ZWU0_9ENTR|nr:hypothetical protein C3708_22480 [Lelliottia sp. 7254-16]POZ18947.1 hypothetical protein C3712_22325 [Lelliottia aquatilis]POZ20515.1 hypothetical protein C3711_22530 [Lelliottia aquatilis]POZ30560.1 hypothetical protein C3710_22135 [Lelliottia aquatilis]POZ36115.1 hypothetical protein C3709_22260 [Lelliottia aquatilis]